MSCGSGNPKEFDTSFTIPRTKGNNDLNGNTGDSNDTNLYQTGGVLANDYSNIPNNYSSYVPQENYNSYNASSVEVTTWQQIQQTENPLKRSWLNTVFEMSNNTRYKDTFGDLHDTSLPKELLVQFQPLFCKLCVIQLSSNVMAKLHYKSKNHDKKVRAWLLEYSEQTGEPLHKRAVLPRNKKDEDYDPKHYHCEVCDLALTGKVHAESHYMGKNHQRALYGKKNPSGKGYYDNDGRWIRTGTSKKDDESDGFGRDFEKNNPTKILSGLKCDICNVCVTSVPQLEAHYQGQKHQKKLKHVENGLTIPTVHEDSKTQGEVALKIDPDILSSYRTPSGNFYCKTCNLSLNSEVQFLQHLKSKKHSKKLSPPSPEPQTADDIFLHL